MRTPAFAVLGVFALLASCAPTADGGVGGDAPPRARQCFSVSQVVNFEQGRPDQIFLRVGRTDVYELNAAGACPDMVFANRIALIPDGGTVGTRLCTDDWARIVAPDSTAQTSVCRVRVSRKLTAEEVAALPERHRP
ncbi:MAG: DUF6491 family protein [Brevundimonas sp.]|uniref:DUF6491 family protein n=1 Tax=Brevundimonas sp. TaxID=1871086 RepID=UPI002718C186|nr:DUF6491 family protein [Brevundimonas sp.]MDO9588159.1 DUF6491 family protein [Brevundimonas sp.]